jgi:hypothetical protein
MEKVCCLDDLSSSLSFFFEKTAKKFCRYLDDLSKSLVFCYAVWIIFLDHAKQFVQNNFYSRIQTTMGIE